MLISENFGEAWESLLQDLVTEGTSASPRGKSTLEFLDIHLRVKNPLANILVNARRNPSYRFMVAEWLWIWFGHRDVVSIAQYNKNIAQYSDNGSTFAGAYGPKVVMQYPRVLELLSNDPMSRQAIISIFDPAVRDQKSRDVPCTLSLQFLLRENELHTIVNMRSSDIWLGLPYDFFNFSMLANIFAQQLRVKLGFIDFNLGSSHLYLNTKWAAEEALKHPTSTLRSPAFTELPHLFLDLVFTHKRLDDLLGPLKEPWNSYANIMVAPTNSQALEVLRALEPR